MIRLALVTQFLHGVVEERHQFTGALVGKMIGEPLEFVHDDGFDVFLELAARRRGITCVREPAARHGEPLVAVREHSRKVRDIRPGIVVEMQQDAFDKFAVIRVEAVECRRRRFGVHPVHFRAADGRAYPAET